MELQEWLKALILPIQLTTEKMERHLPTILVFNFLLYKSSGQLLSADDNEPRTYIVHVTEPRGSQFLLDTDLESWHRSFLPNATLDAGQPRLVYSYRDVVSGFAARLTADEVSAMESREGFLHAQPDQRLSLTTTHTPSFLGLSEWQGLWPDTFQGQGVIIGVLDSGVTPKHPSFQDDGTMPPPPPRWAGTCGFRNKSLCNNKLIGATAFHNGMRPTPRDPKDNGHGTHVSGIAVGTLVDGAEVRGQAQGRASGTAPRAHLAVYKVCFGHDCAGSDFLAAVDQAIKDGVNVLSASIGTSNKTLPFYDDLESVALLAAVRKGIFACVSAGNSGPYKSEVSNSAPWMMTVGASGTDRRITAVVRLGNGAELEGESAYQPENFNSTYWPLEFPSFKGRPGGYGCKNDSFDNINITGKIVMCPFGDIESVEKGEFVKKAGGAAMILLNTFLQGSTTFADNHVLPVVQVSYPAARAIIKYLTSDPAPTATILFTGTHFGARPSPGVAYFSSRGPSLVNGGILKPDVLGPGVNILSAWPGKKTGFNFQSGTSMATPHLSGIVALLKNAHPQWSPAAIRSAIMTTADRLDLDGKPMVDEYEGTGNAANLFAMGAGQVNPSAANDPGLVYDIRPYQYIHYLCGLGYTDKQASVVARRPMQCSNTPNISAEQLNYPSISVSVNTTSTTTATIRRLVTNVGNANEIYYVRTEDPTGVSVAVSPGKLRFSRLDQKKTFTVDFRIKSGAFPRKGEVSEGQLMWISAKHLVRSPISVAFF